jgi:hypothetical protein
MKSRSDVLEYIFRMMMEAAGSCETSITTYQIVCCPYDHSTKFSQPINLRYLTYVTSTDMLFFLLRSSSTSSCYPQIALKLSQLADKAYVRMHHSQIKGKQQTSLGTYKTQLVSPSHGFQNNAWGSSCFPTFVPTDLYVWHDSYSVMLS